MYFSLQSKIYVINLECWFTFVGPINSQHTFLPDSFLVFINYKKYLSWSTGNYYLCHSTCLAFYNCQLNIFRVKWDGWVFINIFFYFHLKILNGCIMFFYFATSSFS